MKQRNLAFNPLYVYTKALSVALGYRDTLTSRHSERVQFLSEEIGMHRNLTDKHVEALKIAAVFHDIGKIGIPDHILLKPSRFDETEWEKMKQHSAIGEKIMSATELDGSGQAALVIRHHHEHFDGSGYPDGLVGESIPICARIISIADSYDAMAVTRSYHNARTHSEIMEVLQAETGKKHDPELMDVFSKIIETSEFKAASV